MTGAIVISGLAEVLASFCPFEPGMGLKPPPECAEAMPFVIDMSLRLRGLCSRISEGGLAESWTSVSKLPCQGLNTLTCFSINSALSGIMYVDTCIQHLDTTRRRLS